MRYRDEIKRIHNENGLKGFTRGYPGMMIRDTVTNGIYFCLFDLFKRHLGVPSHTTSSNDITLSHFQIALRTLLSGGVAGTIAWTVAFPFDTVKVTI
jgi:hypothetical protein